MEQKAEELAKSMGKKHSVQLMGGLRCGKPREYCVEAYAWCRKKCRFLAADEWIKRE
jgi:hypothetical protein